MAASEQNEDPTAAAEHSAFAYGRRWQSDIPLTAFHPATSSTSTRADIVVRHASDALDTSSLRQRSSRIWRGPGRLRYESETGLAFDTFAGSRVEIRAVPGRVDPDPARELPLAFYGTVTAALVAWQGLVPMHGTAVELAGKAVLICGPSGAGKSTFAAAMVARGARLISDDLSVLHAQPGKPLTVFAGRRTLRLFPETAGFAENTIAWTAPPRSAGNKIAVSPPCVDPEVPFPLATVIFLGNVPITNMPMLQNPTMEDSATSTAALQRQIFRPALMTQLPHHKLRQAALAFAAPHLSFVMLSGLQVWSKQEFESVSNQLPRV